MAKRLVVLRGQLEPAGPAERLARQRLDARGAGADAERRRIGKDLAPDALGTIHESLRASTARSGRSGARSPSPTARGGVERAAAAAREDRLRPRRPRRVPRGGGRIVDVVDRG